MNLLQLAATLPGVTAVYDHDPETPPQGLYAVVFSVSQGTRSTGNVEASGVQMRRESFTEALNLYGGADVPASALRPVLEAATFLNPGHTLAGRPVAGVTYGPHLPVRYDSTHRRGWCAARFNLLTQVTPPAPTTPQEETP